MVVVKLRLAVVELLYLSGVNLLKVTRPERRKIRLID
jgi:hypothetical protein